MEVLKSVGTGKKKVLIGYPTFITPKLEEVLQVNDVTLFWIEREFYGRFYDSLPKQWTTIGLTAPAYGLDKAMMVASYREIMDILVSAIVEAGIGYVLLNSNMWHPKYLAQLKERGILLTTKIVDDPEGSAVYSEPIVRYYDKCICSGVDYDSRRTISEMYYQWGAKEVKFLPVFVDPRHYDDAPIEYEKKDIDIIHVGSFNWKRWIALHRLYHRFGGRLHLYSRYDPRRDKTLFRPLYKVLNLVFPLPQVENIGDEELKLVYKRSKIGFNKHLSYGPSNARSYELCLNGVLQITDNEHGYQSLYEIGKEIICYKSIDEALDRIAYFLDHDSERETIAQAGYEKAVKEYTYEAVMEKHFRYILA